MNKGNVVISASGNGHSAIATWWIIGVIGAVIGVVVGCCVENSMSGSYLTTLTTQYGAHNIWIGAGMFFSVVCLVMAHAVQSRIGKTVINVYENYVEGVGVFPKFSLSLFNLMAFKYTYGENFSIEVVNGNTVVINASYVQHKVYAMNAIKIRDAIMSRKNEFAVADEWIEMSKKLFRGNLDDLTMAGMAMAQDRVDVMKLLVARGLPIGMKDEKGETCVHVAAFGGGVNVMDWLKKTYNVDINESSKNGDVPICIAAGCGHVKMVEWLLDNGVDVNSKGQRDLTPMHQAALQGRIDVMECLKKNGANVHERCDDGWSAMESAISNNQTESIKCLVRLGFDVNAKGKDGRTAIFIAAMGKEIGKGGMIDCIKCLAELGADVNARDENHWTPIFEATRYGQADSIRCLAALGADVNVKDINGGTPIIVAAQEGYADCVNCLGALGADVNVKVGNGATPLFAAVAGGHIAVIKCLAALGADVNAKANNGMGTIDLAAKKGWTEGVECLEKLGAKKMV